MVTVIVSFGADADDVVTSERLRNLTTSLRALQRQILPRDQYRIVLVEQGVQSRIDATIRALVDEHILAYNPQPFNRSWGRNIGAVYAAPGVICTLDADIVVPPSFLLRGRLAWQCGARAIRPFSGMLYLDPESTQRVHDDARDGDGIDCEARHYRGGLHLKSKGGCIWTDRRLYLELGGHDERFEGWGSEDNEFWDRLSAATTIVRLDGRLLHLYHGRPFETAPEARGNYMMWHLLQHRLLPRPRTRTIGDLDRYRPPDDLAPTATGRSVATGWHDRHQLQRQMQDTIVRDAMRVCQQPRTSDEPDPSALHVRALLAMRNREDDTALACLTGALRLDPCNVQCVTELGRVLVRKRRATEAVSAQLRAITLAPHDPTPYRELGRVLYRVGRLSEGTLVYQEALQLDPGDARTVGELGEVLHARGLVEQALAACEIARKWDRKSLHGYVRLGRVRLARHEWELAREVFREGLAVAEEPRVAPAADSPRTAQAGAALWAYCSDDTALDDWYPPRPQAANGEISPTVDPSHVALYAGLGESLARLGRIDEAIDAFHRALNLDPHHLEASRRLVLAYERIGRRHDAVGAWVSLGGALDARHRFDEAVVAYRQAERLKRDSLKALIQRGRVHAIQADLTAAIDCFTRALAIDPQQPRAHSDLGRALSVLGHVDAGWGEFAWWCRPFRLQSRALAQPLWDGSRLDGRTLLVWADQELGDTIQWLRYVPVLERLRARVVVECQARLVPLVATMPGTLQVVSRQAPLPAFDVHAPLTLLPIVSPTCRAAPCQAPYFTADATLVDVWKQRLVDGGDRTAFTVGLSWAGHPEGIHRAFRFAPLTAFAPLAGLSHVRFISLQMGPQISELLGAPARLRIEHLQDGTCSASDTAALVQSLDLIITVDTMVAHLAGALGRPVWLVLPFVADWRWMQDRERTQLYPTMRLFRQEAAGDWGELFTRVRRALAVMVARD